MFIVLEGIDGCGKTTQSIRLEGTLSRLGRRVVRTFEPGGWDGGEMMRGMLMRGEFASAFSQYLIFTADRCEHVSRVIGPALASGSDVVCDRYIPSTVAYQLSGGEMSAEVRERLASLPYDVGMPRADVVIWLDMDIASARARMEARGSMTSFDRADAGRVERVRRGYIDQWEASSARGERWLRVDASRSEDEVADDIMKGLERWL